MTLPAVHVCIATGQNAANLIPLEQYDAREIWILQTAAMRQSASNLERALQRSGRKIVRIDFDDRSPGAMVQDATTIAERLDGQHVVLHATGGTKLMVLALRDGLRYVEAGNGQLEILYADTGRQQIDWLGAEARTDAMDDHLDLRQMLLVQGYSIDGDSRHAAAQKRATARAQVTREMGENAARYGKFFSALATLASRAADSEQTRDLTQHFHYPPGGQSTNLIRLAHDKGLLSWAGEETITFTDRGTAQYFAGGWLEEFVLLKLTGSQLRPGRYSSNLRVLSTDKNVPNEIDAMVVHRNRALLIECKTGRQDKAQDAIYKLSQLRHKLGGSVASALYISAQQVSEEVHKRASEYGIHVLCSADIGRFMPWFRDWMNK